MLKLVYVKNVPRSYYELKFLDSPKYRNRGFSYLFGITDIDKHIFYYYTQKDIEEKFLKNNISIEGISSKDNKMCSFALVSTDDISFEGNTIIFNNEMYKLKLGYCVSLRNVYLSYKNIIFYKANSCYVIDGIVRKPNLLFLLRKLKNIPFLNNGLFKEDNVYYTDYQFCFNLDNRIKQVLTNEDIIKSCNEISMKNVVTDYTSLFENIQLEKIDLTNLFCKDALIMERMFFNCNKLKHIIFCKLDLRIPIKLCNLFENCENLEFVDFTLLKNDSPKDVLDFLDYDNEVYFYLNISVNQLKNYCILALPTKATLFVNKIVEINRLKYLGNTNKNNMINFVNTFRSKLILKGVKPTDNVYYITVNN